MTSIRYNEIMEAVTVTPQMRERVLAGVEAAASGPGPRSGTWKRYAAIAACLILVLIGSLTLPGLLKREAEPVTEPPVNQVPWGSEEFASLQALSEAAGFPVRGVPSLEASALRRVYSLFWGNLAQIDYETAAGEYCFRVRPGLEDVSGDYNEYAKLLTQSLEGCEVRFHGNGDCAYADWTREGRAYALFFPAGTDYQSASALVLETLCQ